MSYNSGKRQVTTRAFVVKCHPNDVEILKQLRCRVYSTENSSTYGNSVHFFQWGLCHILSNEYTGVRSFITTTFFIGI